MSEAIDGDRGSSSVDSTRRRRLSKQQTIGLYVVGTAVIVGFVFWKNPGVKPEPEERVSQTGIRQTVQPDLLQANPPIQTTPLVVPVPKPEPLVLPTVTNMMPGPREKRVRMLSYAAAPAPAPPVEQPGTAASGGPQRTAGTTVAWKGVQLPGARAGAAIDLTYTLIPGIYHCTLDTAISSETAGPFMCHTSEDVRSPEGVTLMDRGTTIVGTYQSDIHQGQTRIPTLAVTAFTPNGVLVPLNAPMADGLGRVGLDGDVNNHYGQRFGGALLLLLTNGALNAAQAALSHGNNNTYLNIQGGGGGLESVATEALRNSINIPPTITKNQGEDVAFFVTAPISFADAYSLRTTN